MQMNSRKPLLPKYHSQHHAAHPVHSRITNGGNGGGGGRERERERERVANPEFQL
jgi:hypothetical protein